MLAPHPTHRHLSDFLPRFEITCRFEIIWSIAASFDYEIFAYLKIRADDRGLNGASFAATYYQSVTRGLARFEIRAVGGLDPIPLLHRKGYGFERHGL